MNTQCLFIYLIWIAILKFQVLSMSRLGGAGAVAQLVADIPLSVKVTLTRIYGFRLEALYEIILIEIVVHFLKLYNPFHLHRTEQRHNHIMNSSWLFLFSNNRIYYCLSQRNVLCLLVSWLVMIIFSTSTKESPTLFYWYNICGQACFHCGLTYLLGSAINLENRHDVNFVPS